MESKWDERFLELAEHISTWSKDPSTKVGAVLVGPDKLIVGVGYNGFPRGVNDSDDRLNDRPTKYKFVVHAEVNALLMAGTRARGATLYVTPTFAIPNICNECAKFAIQAGVKELVSWTPTGTEEQKARWGEAIAISKAMLDESGVTYRTVDA